MATLTAGGLADKLGPKIQAAFQAKEKELVSAAHPWFVRQAIGLAYPTFLEQIPTLTRMAIDLVATEFGSMNVNDLLSFLEQHAKQSLGPAWRFSRQRDSFGGPDVGGPGMVGGPPHDKGPTP